MTAGRPSARPRFIAGAVCPRCRAVDRIVVRNAEDGAERACVACGFREAAAVSSPAPTLGRHDAPPSPRDEAPAQRVTIVDPKTSGSTGERRDE